VKTSALDCIGEQYQHCQALLQPQLGISIGVGPSDLTVASLSGASQASRPSPTTGPLPGHIDTQQLSRATSTDVVDCRRRHCAYTGRQPVHHNTNCVGVSWALVCKKFNHFLGFPPLLLRIVVKLCAPTGLARLSIGLLDCGCKFVLIHGIY